MTSAENRNRQPAGVSTGGQFAPETKGETTATLAGAGPSTPAPAPLGDTLGGFASEEFTGAVADFREAKNLKEFADAVRATYPGAVAIRPDLDEGTSYAEYVLADGTTNAVFLEEDGALDGEPPMLYPHESHGQIQIADIDDVYARCQARYADALAAALLPDWAPDSVRRVPQLPEQVPAGHRIETDLDADGDGRATLVGPDGELAMVVHDIPTQDEPEVYADDSPGPWVLEHKQVIADELQVAAANYRDLSEQLAQHVGDIPAVRDRLQAIATGAQR